MNHLTDTRILRLAVFALAIALAPAVVSIAAGAKHKTMSKSELKHLVDTAETKTDHESIAQYFDDEAAKLRGGIQGARGTGAGLSKERPGSAKYPGSMQT